MGIKQVAITVLALVHGGCFIPASDYPPRPGEPGQQQQASDIHQQCAEYARQFAPGASRNAAYRDCVRRERQRVAQQNEDPLRTEHQELQRCSTLLNGQQPDMEKTALIQARNGNALREDNEAAEITFRRIGCDMRLLSSLPATELKQLHDLFASLIRAAVQKAFKNPDVANALARRSATAAGEPSQAERSAPSCTRWSNVADKVIAAKRCDLFKLFPDLATKYDTPLGKKTFLQSTEAQNLKAKCKSVLAQLLLPRYCVKVGDLDEYDVKKKAFEIEFGTATNSIKNPAAKTIDDVWFPRLNIRLVSEHFNASTQKIMHAKYLRASVPEKDAGALEKQRSHLAAFIRFTATPAIKGYTEVSFEGNRWPQEYVVASNEEVLVADKDTMAVVWPPQSPARSNPQNDTADGDEEGASVASSEMMKEAIGGIALGKPPADVKALLGSPEKIDPKSEEPATGLFTQAWTYHSRGIVVTLAADSAAGPQRVHSMEVSAPSKMRTGRDIGIGSTAAQVEKAYGKFKAKGSTAGQFTAGSPYGGVFIDLAHGRVTRIYIGPGAE